MNEDKNKNENEKNKGEVLDKVIRAVGTESIDIHEHEHAVISLITTDSIDRAGEVVDARGAVLENYRKNPVVLWAHQYDEPPIGVNLWIKRAEHGLVAKTRFANTDDGRAIFELYRDGVLRAWSIGFRPIEWSEPKSSEVEWRSASRVYRKWELLEYSAAPVPANADALTIAVSKGLVLPKRIEAALTSASAELKRVIPHKRYPLAPEDTDWDAASEVAAASVDDLREMCAWYDDAAPDVKSSYKLPHHTARGYRTVWRAVAAAMAALMGARGGVDIPQSDRRGVYNHLVAHYREFDKEPPEFRSDASIPVIETGLSSQSQSQSQSQSFSPRVIPKPRVVHIPRVVQSETIEEVVRRAIKKVALWRTGRL